MDLGKSSLGNFTTAGPRPATACQANTTHSFGGEGRQDQGKRRRCPNMSWLLRILSDTHRHTEIHRHIETHRHIQRATKTRCPHMLLSRADCTELDGYIGAYTRRDVETHSTDTHGHTETDKQTQECRPLSCLSRRVDCSLHADCCLVYVSIYFLKRRCQCVDK